MTSFAIASRNRIDWSAICNCIYVGNKGSSPNKYSYVTLDIILAPDLMSQKVMWNILCPMVHLIVGTPRSSFLARNGEARRWSYSDRSVLIMLTNSSWGCLALFFLLLLLFFLLVTVVSSGRYGVYGCLADCRMRFLKENFFLSLIVKQILALSAYMMAFAVLTKGRSKIMGALTSPPVSKTTKSTGTFDCPTRTMVYSKTPLG